MFLISSFELRIISFITFCDILNPTDQNVSLPGLLEASLRMTGQSCTKDYRVKPDNDTSFAWLSPICTKGKLAVCADYSKVEESTQTRTRKLDAKKREKVANQATQIIDILQIQGKLR